MSAASLVFDETAHRYTLDGRTVPSVTQILKPLYGDLRFVDRDLLDYKSALGVAVHKAVELDVRGELDPVSLVDPVAAYFEQYQLFLRETGFVPLQSEIRVWSALGYAGTLDLVGSLRGYRAIIDLKTTAVLSPAVALQTAAYQHAYNENNLPQVVRRCALRLAPGGYQLHTYSVPDNRRDLAQFHAFLQVHHWCQENNQRMELSHGINPFA